MLIPQWYSIEILGWVLSFQVIIADSTSTVTLGQQASLTTTITAIPPTSLTSRLVNVPAARGGYFTDIQAVQPIYKVHNPSLPNQLIGGIFPLYDDLGMPILSGHQLLLAYQCQIDLINGNTSILPDTQLVPIIQNIGSSSDLQNSRAAYILSQRNTLVSIGPLTQSQNFIFDGILGSKNLTFISYGGVKIDSTDLLPQTADFFTLLPSTSVYVKAIIDTIKRFNWKLISTVFYYHDSITSVDFDILKIALNKSDILTTCDAIIIPSNVDTEISRFVSCLEKTTVTVVILWMNQVIANQVIESLYAVSKFSQITFLAFSDLTYLFCSPEVNPNVAFQGTGLTPGNVTSSYPVSYLEGSISLIPRIGNLSPYRACASQASPDSFGTPQSSLSWQYFFSCQLPTSQNRDLPLCSDTGERTTPCLCTGNENFDSFPPITLVSNVMDATSLAALALNQIVNYTACVEVFNLDPSVCNTDYIEPQLYQMSLEKTIYDGFTGPIRFLGGSLALEYSTFDVRQIGTNGKIKTVGFTNITNSYLEASLLTFKQPVPQPEPPAPKTDYPSSVIAPEEIDISDTRIILSTIFSFIILLVVVALMISIYFQRDSPKVKGIGFIWVEMLFFAIIMMAISKISSSLVSESTARCITVSTLDLTGWGLFTGCFLQKAFRYFGILMNFKNYPQLVLPETNELKVFLQVLMFSIPLVVLMAMYFGDALQATIMPTTSPYAEYYACKTIDQSYGNGIAYTATAYIGITLLVTTLVFIFSMRVGIRRSKIKADELKLLILIATNVLIVYILFSPYYYTLTAVPGALFEQYILRILCTHLAIVISIFEVVYYLGVGFFTFWLKKSREAINNEVMDENFRRSLDTSRSGQSNYGDRTSSLTETDESTLPSSHSETTIMSGSRSTIMHDDQSEIESGITVLEE